MIPFAYGRKDGLALKGPALLLALTLSALCLGACRTQTHQHFFQGAALGTGYHITLYADLNQEQKTGLEAGIQSELASLEQQRQDLVRMLNAGYNGFSLSPPAVLMREIDQAIQARAVDRLTQQLTDPRVEPIASMVEVGGVVQARGIPPAGAWRMSLEQAGLPEADNVRYINLQDAALVQRFSQQVAAPLVTLSTPLAVSVVASSASEAMQLARQLIHAKPTAAVNSAKSMDSAARVVVKTHKGIEIHHTAALDRWLEP